ncbi:MAG: PQQ-dependent sugar dehydrogenase [Bacteroidia bacterium]|nr:PQQ-dependent sugar dehydrogenase [Bacteroidia bacterium]
MQNRIFLLLALVVLGLSQKLSAQAVLREAFPNLRFENPIELLNPPDSSDRIFIVSQKGTIYVIPNRDSFPERPVFLDIRSRLVSGGERGLLGLAFHPQYAQNGYFYLYYTRNRNNQLESVLSRFEVDTQNPDRGNPNSEQELLRFAQPFSNHNGGKIAFGPDGYLYIASGDGGSAGDPQNNAQTLTNLLGKILRIDVDQPPGNLSYAIPPDNPLVANADGFREEIFCLWAPKPLEI